MSGLALLESGPDLPAVLGPPARAQAGIRADQELVGYRDVKATMIDTHLLHRGPAGVRSPLDGM